jgi:hypothetical protein
MPDQDGEGGEAAVPAPAPPEVKARGKHGGARPGAGRPRGPLPRPLRDRARDLVTAIFNDARVAQIERLQAAIALMLEPEYFGPACDRTAARYMARLRAMTRVEITRTHTFREVMRDLNAALDADEAAAEAGSGPAGDDAIPAAGSPIGFAAGRATRPAGEASPAVEGVPPPTDEDITRL